jgi:hypothetical protein
MSSGFLGLKSAPRDLLRLQGLTKFLPKGRGAGAISVSDSGNFVGLLVFFRTIGRSPFPLKHLGDSVTKADRRHKEKKRVVFVLYELYCIAYVA